MAEIKRTWSVPTSPRSPYKLPKELSLLEAFEGKRWNRENQCAFAERLAASDFYEGGVSKASPDFSARDRINRSPTTFGFVDLSEGKVKLTKAGIQLIKEGNVEDLFTKQLLKWQYPSIKHSGPQYGSFNIKPFLEILRLTDDLGGLSKREIAIFCIPLIDFANYSIVRSAISVFREHLKGLNSNERKRYITRRHTEEFEKIYAQEISSDTFHIRERKGKSLTKTDFINTKVRNSIDYADSAIRYFRATGLFKLSATTFRLTIIDSKLDQVKEILEIAPREPISIEETASFLEYLGNPALPVLPNERPEVLRAEISHLVDAVALRNILPKDQLDEYRQEKLVASSLADQKTIRDELERIIRRDTERTQISALQSYSLYDDIIRMYDKISSRSDYDIPDRPLFFEWNTWRAFAMLNDGKIKCNSKLDVEGKPLSTAPGGGPDAIAEYEQFVLCIEVTLSRGERQFETENESVPRHLGKISKKLRDNSDKRPVFGIFIADGLGVSSVAHFFTLRRSNVLHYGGKAIILPLDLKTFKEMLEVAKSKGGIKAQQLYNFLIWADKEADMVENEEEWRSSIERKIPSWTSC